MPPQRSGVSDYSYQVLAELSQHLVVTAVVDDRVIAEVRSPPGVEVLRASRAAQIEFDVDVYQMGNHWLYHGFMFRMALRRPGLLVLHDPSLYDCVLALTGGDPASALFREEVAYDANDGNSLAPSMQSVNVDRLRYLLSRRLVETNILTLVHSRWAAGLLSSRYGSEVRNVGMPTVIPESEASKEPFRQPVTFGVMGGLARHKRITQLVEAFTELEDSDARLVIAGHQDDPTVLSEIEDLISRAPGARSRVALELSPSLERLHQLIAEVDVLISLRWPTAGETSATLATALGMGRPVIVSDVPQLLEIPDAACWRIPIDPSVEFASIQAVLRSIEDRPEQLSAASNAARDYARSELALTSVVDRYLEAILRVAGTSAPVGPVSTRSAERSMVRTDHRCARVHGSVAVLGMNAVGSWSSATGLAEAARRSLLATMDAGVAVTTNDCDIGTPTDARRVPIQLRTLPSGRPFSVDVCYLNLNEIECLPEEYVRERRAGRMLVAGCWFWESNVVPVRLRRLIDRFGFDVILAGSTFARDCLRPHVRCRVDVVPVVVAPRPDASLSRRDFRLPESRTAYLCNFDAFSGLHRKNPLGAIESYRKAFARRSAQADVSLVVKSSNLHRLPEARCVVESALASVDGVLIDDELTEREMASLIALSDVYISLHRAEGFGLGAAEAMALGKPVVATGYSGTNDFVSSTTGRRVGYRLVDISPGDLYLNPGLTVAEMYRDSSVERAVWAEPDLADAARWLAWMQAHPRERRALGRRGERLMADRYSAGRVGATMRAIVTDLGRYVESDDAGLRARSGRLSSTAVSA